jgi:hypothetical protein
MDPAPEAPDAATEAPDASTEAPESPDDPAPDTAPEAPNAADLLAALNAANEPTTPPSNADAIFAIMHAQNPPEPERVDAVPDTEIAKYSALAQNPKLGEAFTIGGREFHYQFLSIAAEERLIEMIKVVLIDAPKGNLLAGFFESLPRAKEAVALILADQAPECDVAWLESRPRTDADAPRIARLVGIIVAQMKLNEITDFLQQVSQIAALIGQVVGASTRA